MVAGGMKELGEKSEEFHRMIGESIADRKLDLLVTIGEDAWHIARGAMDSGMARERAFMAEDHEHAAEIVREIAGPEAVVLLKGSRSTKMEEVLKCYTTSYTR